jgi:hypothetical protein
VKQEISPKVFTAVIVVGILLIGGIAFWVLRAPSAKAIDTAPTTAADAPPPSSGPRINRGREMAKEMREMHTRGHER